MTSISDPGARARVKFFIFYFFRHGHAPYHQNKKVIWANSVARADPKVQTTAFFPLGMLPARSSTLPPCSQHAPACLQYTPACSQHDHNMLPARNTMLPACSQHAHSMLPARSSMLPPRPSTPNHDLATRPWGKRAPPMRVRARAICFYFFFVRHGMASHAEKKK